LTLSDFEPRILCFACNWCSYAAADIAGTSRLQYPPNVRLIRVMCSGMVSPSYILRALEKGADGVLVMGCHPGDCHYISGNHKAEEMVGRLKKLLDVLGLEEERLKLKWIATSEGPIFAKTIQEYVEQLKKLGPSVFRKDEAA
jgi:F420-non-reducing hydrogenase iron-sulfur subunit